MGVKAPVGVTRAYYFAYPIGLFVSFMVYWGLCWKWPVQIQYGLGEWMEVKDFVRVEERGERGGSGWGSMVSGEDAAEGVLVDGGEKGNLDGQAQGEEEAGVRHRAPETSVVEK